MTTDYFAHSRVGQPCETWEPLEAHLQHVAITAARFTAPFDSAEWGRIAGLWHDVGKYQAAFQRRIRGSTERAPHSAVGALFAFRRKLLPVAFAIAGHHAGLPNDGESASGTRALRARISEADGGLQEVERILPSTVLDPADPELPPHLARCQSDPNQPLMVELWIRFLFSALVDADFLETERFYGTVDRSRILPPPDSLAAMATALDRFIGALPTRAPVDVLRNEVLDWCRGAASSDRGVFSLTVPTGGGKTLSSLAFALRHAQVHRLGRVIVVVPFTSIIEQTAEVFRKALGAQVVLEHHSAVAEASSKDSDSEAALRQRLAAENWDSPIVVTTAVQFFESLFANSPSRCRKLHNIARSVIIIDEAQTIPTDFLLIVLDAVQQLVAYYGCTVLLSTATQPALRVRPALAQGLVDIREIAADPIRIARQLRRITVEWPERGERPEEGRILSFADLATEIQSLHQVMVIVHRRADARVLAEMTLNDSTFHLSGLMCAEHRSAVLHSVREALGSGRPCTLVTTQLVEAGVDIDFPTVFRAIAGLDSLAQAAGRCNRNGMLRRADGSPDLGRFVVFLPETSPPPGNPARGARITQQMLVEYGAALDFADQAHLDEYFRRFYETDRDKHKVMPQRRLLNFATVAERVRWIADDFSSPAVAPWGGGLERLGAFRRNPSRDTQRALQRYLVQLPRGYIEELVRSSLLEQVGSLELFAPVDPESGLYDRRFGFAPPGEASAPLLIA